MKLSIKTTIGMLIVVSVLVMTNNLVQGLETIDFQKQLALFNKPYIKTFKTKYGDIVDCVEIYKQPAFDHPLLKNHSIQTKPTIKHISKPSSTPRTRPEISPENMKCPKGTVAIKRVQKEDLKMVNFSPWLYKMNHFLSSKNDMPNIHHVATILMKEKNVGVHGSVNAWGVANIVSHQFTTATIFLASGDGSNTNGIIAGWFVDTFLFPNNTRLFAYWTKDGSKTTGCFNSLCPGFVQVSRETTLGQQIQPLSTYNGPQYEIELRIEQDMTTGNWWLYYGGKSVGYYPKELFTSLNGGADWAGWGGEIVGSNPGSSPPMGSGHFPEEGFGKSCFIRKMNLVAPSRTLIYPDKRKVQKNISNAQCYRASYFGQGTGDDGHFMFFGGPPDCPK